ncbi:MAG: YciI family protein, partial [Planctomycetes bacterium]|nr:YciI family protein [Planctomycetota bacterium]
ADKRLKVVDGPFAETKDVIGGFYLVKADSYSHCVDLIQDHPHLEFGQTITVREIDPVSEE